MFVDGSHLENNQGIFCAGYAITFEYSAIEVAPLQTDNFAQIAEQQLHHKPVTLLKI